VKAYLAALRITGLVGCAIGAAVGCLPWQPMWPTFSIFEGLRGAAIGWLAGAVLALPAGWLRPIPSRAQSRLSRIVQYAITALAVAPGLLWMTMAAPGGLLRQAMESVRAPRDQRPNLILITIEATRPDRLGAYGSSRGLTPNLDAFAREATRYDSAYVSSSWTLPSLAALFTGLLPSSCVIDGPHGAAHVGEVVYRLRPRALLLSEQLARQGYATVAELTNHLLSRDRGWSRGFEFFRNESSIEDYFVDLAAGGNVTKRASEWLQRNRHEPFLLWVHYFDPHVPYDSPDTPAALRARYPTTWVAHRKQWVGTMRYASPDERKLYQRFCREMYAEEVRYADKCVGQLLAQIKSAGLYDRSLIAITADHGEELFDRGDEMEHGHTMRKPVVWVPLLVKWPRGVEADRRIRQTVGMADLHGTLLESAKAIADGADVRALPRRDGAKGQEVFSEWIYYGRQQAALTTDDYRVIYHPEADAGQPRFEVYDRRRDPDEREDRAGTKAAMGLRERLQQMTEVALKRRAASAGEGGPAPAMSEKEKRDLKSLGYVQ
jgi:arylsulfatase A-like enzyme